MFTARSRQNPFSRRPRKDNGSPEPAPEPAQAPQIDTEAEHRARVAEVERMREEMIAAAAQLTMETAAKPSEPLYDLVSPEVSEVGTPVLASSEQSAPVEEPEEPKRGRGRPRPQATIDRDNAVYNLLKIADKDGATKEALAVALGEKEQQVYSSLRQLKREGRAEVLYIKGHGYRWFAIVSLLTSENA